MKHLFAFFLCIIILATLRGQERIPCDTIYRQVDQEVRYAGGSVALSRYLNKELLPFVAACYQQDSTMIDRVTTVLVIDATGKVRQVELVAMELPDSCSARLRKGLLSMKGWEPATRKGQLVCSYYRWIIPCILWQEE